MAILNKVRSAEIDGMCVFGVRTDHSSGPKEAQKQCVSLETKVKTKS